MLSKLYDRVKTIIRDNYKFFLILIFFGVIVNIRLPYYIDAPGGLIDLSDRIRVNNTNKLKGSLNLTYVSEMQATLPTLIYAALDKNWDIYSAKDITIDNEDIADMELRDKIMLKEAYQTATILAYQEAKKNITINSYQLLVTYIDETAKTDLKVGDQILSINEVNVNTRDELNNEKDKYLVGTEVTFKIKRNGKEMTKSATIIEYEKELYIGIMVSELKDFTTTPPISFNFLSSESGSSGGLMTTLSIYGNLTNDDLTKGEVIAGTGTIDSDGQVGEIGGIKYKLIGALNNKATVFIVPTGDNYKDVMKLKKENNYHIEIIEAKTFDQVVSSLKNRISK